MSMTAVDLASDFASRINEHGWVRLTARQVAFLRRLVAEDRTGNAANWRAANNGPMTTIHLRDGREVEVVVYHNGAGVLRVKDR